MTPSEIKDRLQVCVNLGAYEDALNLIQEFGGDESAWGEIGEDETLWAWLWFLAADGTVARKLAFEFAATRPNGLIKTPDNSVALAEAHRRSWQEQD